MPEFILDTQGDVRVQNGVSIHGRALTWRDLDSFTQGYIEALFFTAGEAPGTLPGADPENEAWEVGFADLAPEALDAIVRDCERFVSIFDKIEDAAITANAHALNDWPDDAQAGRDFWYTRNGHGCGFWDGDWPEPYAAQLTAAAKAFRAVDVDLGADGKVHLS